MIAAVLSAAPATGQGAAAAPPVRSESQGLRLGGHFSFASYDLTEEAESGAERGPGVGASIGYGISSRLGVFLAGDVERLDYEETSGGESFALRTLDIGVRYTAGRPASRLRPYGELAVSQVMVSDDLEGIEYRFTGQGLTAGVGAEYFVSRALALDATVHATRGRLSDGVFDGDPVEPDEDLVLLRFGLGLAWHPRVAP